MLYNSFSHSFKHFYITIKVIMQLCIWRNCQYSPTIYGWIVCTKINHVNYFVQLSTLRWATISNTLMCNLYNFYSNKARFIHTSTVTRLHSCPGTKNTRTLACILFLYRNQYVWTFLRQTIQQKILAYHSVLLGACPQPCSNRADTILYYIKKNILKCFKTKLYQNIY